MTEFCPLCKASLITKREKFGEWLICPACKYKKLFADATVAGTAGKAEKAEKEDLKEGSGLESMIGSATIEIAKGSKVNCGVLLSRQIGAADVSAAVVKMKIIRKMDKKIDIESKFLEIELMPVGSVAQIRMIIRKAVDAGHLKEGDNIIVVADESLGIGFEGLFLFFKIDKKFMELTTFELKKELKKSVYESVLQIAHEIGKEGREGKHIGTIFVLGDHESVLKQSRQIILNPFEGHSLEKRNITDIALKETIKELAQLDGAFIIDSNGYIHAAGRYLTAEANSIELPGLGTRHRAAAAITQQTHAVAVCVSESGGVVRVFRGGKLIEEERPS